MYGWIRWRWRDDGVSLRNPIRNELPYARTRCGNEPDPVDDDDILLLQTSQVNQIQVYKGVKPISST